jgi:hypothetical protein
VVDGVIGDVTEHLAQVRFEQGVRDSDFVVSRGR